MSLSSSRFIHVVSVLLLVLWGVVSLYFYATGRIAQYLPDDGWFRPLVLWSGVGMIALGLFNLFTMGSKEAACGHDHEHSACGHDHGHGHKDDEQGCCGHDHGHGCCGHEHGHEHEHEHGCCGHGHGGHHEHDCGHGHGGDEGHDHAHGVLNESGAAGKIFAILMLSLPVSYAAMKTPDKFSVHAVMNKGVYNQNYGSTARADEFSLKKKVDGRSVPQSGVGGEVGQQAPEMVRAVTSVTDDPQGGVMVPVPDADKIPEAQGQEAKDYGEFTLADLEAQIPKSAAGNFILEVPEIYYTAGDKQVQEVLNGQPVETVAQILPEKGEFNAEGKRARIFRMLVQCCAADARPYSIPVEFAGAAPKFKDMSWVKITGKMGYETQNGQIVPVLRADSIAESAQPDDQMVY